MFTPAATAARIARTPEWQYGPPPSAGTTRAGAGRGARRQDAGVEVRPVAQVGEDVRGVGERRLPDPGHALAAHLGEGLGLLGVDPGRNVVAADAGQGAAALGHLGARVVG